MNHTKAWPNWDNGRSVIINPKGIPKGNGYFLINPEGEDRKLADEEAKRLKQNGNPNVFSLGKLTLDGITYSFDYERRGEPVSLIFTRSKELWTIPIYGFCGPEDKVELGDYSPGEYVAWLKK